jgi:ABC-type multidrug transport system fused ATPase/permease subunit
MVICALSEVVSIGSLLPFLSVLTEPELVYGNPWAKPIISALGIQSSDQMLLPFTVIFCIVTALSGALRLLLLFVSSKLTFAVGGDLSISIYQKTLLQPYSIHIARNSSQIIDGVTNKTTSLIECIRCSITIISSIILLSIIVITLFIFQPIITAEAFIGFGIIYFSIVKLTRKRLSDNGDLIAKYSRFSIQSLQESLGGIRDILLDRTQQFYVNIYKNMVLPWRRSQGLNQFISGSPKFAIEALGVILFALIAYKISKSSTGIVGAIPILGVLALSAQRMLPVLQQMFSAWSDLITQRPSLIEALELLEQPTNVIARNLHDKKHPSFKNTIILNNLSFQYSEHSPFVLKNINLQIRKGARVGFIGTTGSGKSTLLDILMGLLEPTKGKMVVDGVVISKENLGSWQDKIAHVPQSIYLTDSTIAENIAFGVEKQNIDYERVVQSAVNAQIAESIAAMQKQYQTIVGERGVNLSGGQRQRIGIARALYKGADVIILDEATSALDVKTEEDVMKSIEALSQDLTLIIVAHRHTTLKGCSDIYSLEHGEIVGQLSAIDLDVK